MYYIIGLGNPGDRYERTRHNAAWMILDELTHDPSSGSWTRNENYEADVSLGTIAGEDSAFIKPVTYMNNSGATVASLFLNDPFVERYIIIHDDIDIPLGAVKLSYNRGSGGHKGVESVMSAFGSKAFFRIRIGIAPLADDGSVVQISGDLAVQRFVLGRFSDEEVKVVRECAKRVERYLTTFISEGREKAISTCTG